jgi:very-short-patch-repair endonuclease
MTEAERKLWNLLRGDQLGVRFRRQAPIGPYIADFACLKAKLIIELDGEQHYSLEGIAHDKKRDEYLRRRGLKVLRFSTVEFLQDTDAILDEICEAIEEAKN